MATKLILDANLSILFFVGITNREYISKHKRLANVYDEVDFDKIKNIIELSDGVIFSPNVLSETSNLLRYIGEPIKSEISATFGEIIVKAEERVVQSKVAVLRQEFLRLGLTDAVLLELTRSGATLLTIDLDLYLAALACGFNAINYNHIKEQRPDFQ